MTSATAKSYRVGATVNCNAPLSWQVASGRVATSLKTGRASDWLRFFPVLVLRSCLSLHASFTPHHCLLLYSFFSVLFFHYSLMLCVKETTKCFYLVLRSFLCSYYHVLFSTFFMGVFCYSVLCPSSVTFLLFNFCCYCTTFFSYFNLSSRQWSVIHIFVFKQCNVSLFSILICSASFLFLFIFSSSFTLYCLPSIKSSTNVCKCKEWLLVSRSHHYPSFEFPTFFFFSVCAVH